MNPPPPAGHQLLTLLGSLAIFAPMFLGGWMLITARRRIDDGAPHCAKCAYNLTDLTSERCPECGIVLSPENRCIGEYSEMRWSRFALGAVLLFVPAMLAIVRFIRSA
ncbi:MAG: hypothetical protein HUU22_03035 [Phycisphaerae bacterium]|nr:hypothetical protein [Phycisphaerae bacterium]NUQ44989.1 hypothetical protein [Phycisphaerae bacterium]